MLGVWVWLTSQQIPIWQSDVTVWTQAVQMSPLRPRPALNLSAALMNAGDFWTAEVYLNWAFSLPREADERLVLKVIRAQCGQWALLSPEPWPYACWP